MFRPATKQTLKWISNYRYNLQLRYACRGTETILPKNISTNRKTKTSYSKLTMKEAQKRLGFTIPGFERHSISIDRMLAEADPKIEGLGIDQLSQMKEEVYENIIKFIECEGYPTESDEDFREANINDLVFTILSPIIVAFRRKTGRNLYLRREKQITASDEETSGYQEFILVDLVGLEKEIFVFVVEAKKSSVGQAKRQCLLAMKGMGDNNHGGLVYGFVTTGEQWQMIRYDGTVFTQTRKFLALFEGMEEEKEVWMKEASAIVDCIHAALRSGGFVV